MDQRLGGSLIVRVTVSEIKNEKNGHFYSLLINTEDTSLIERVRDTDVTEA